jgi:hypothetical protein
MQLGQRPSTRSTLGRRRLLSAALTLSITYIALKASKATLDFFLMKLELYRGALRCDWIEPHIVGNSTVPHHPNAPQFRELLDGSFNSAYNLRLTKHNGSL